MVIPLMAEDPDKKEEQKLEFTPEGETLGYISLDQARVLAMEHARDNQGFYGWRYSRRELVWEELSAEDSEDYYRIQLAYRPAGTFRGNPGTEQFIIDKIGEIRLRQRLQAPSKQGPPVLLLSTLGVIILGLIGVGAVFASGGFGGGGEEPSGIVSLPEATPVATTVNSSVRETPETPTSKPDSTEPSATVGTEGPIVTNPTTFELQPLESDAGLEYVPAEDSPGLEIFAVQSAAQSFTVASAGTITGVELLGIGRHADCQSQGDLNFRLLATVNGFPGVPSLYARALTPQEVAVGRSNLKIDCPEGSPVAAFQTLALELSTGADSTAPCFYGWNGDWPGEYQGGQAFTLTPYSTEWQPDSRDMGFRVFFEEFEARALPEPTRGSSLTATDVPPAPTNTPNAASGLEPNMARIEGNLLFNNQSITEFTPQPPIFQIRDRVAGQECEQSRVAWRALLVDSYNARTGEYATSDLPAGEYCLLTTIDAAEPFDALATLPGDYLSGSGHGTEISLAGGEVKELDLQFKRFLHLFGPVDNGRLPLNLLGTTERVFGSTLEVAWESFGEAVRYDVTIRTCDTVPCRNSLTVFRQSLQQSELQVELPPSELGETYWLNVVAFNAINQQISRFWTTHGSSRNDGLYFSVAQNDSG